MVYATRRPHQVLELPPRLGDALAAVQRGRGQFGVVVLMLDQRECLQDGFELVGRGQGGFPRLGREAQVAGDEAVVPGDQDRLDVRARPREYTMSIWGRFELTATNCLDKTEPVTHQPQ
jgi:hypothetical protein